MVQKEACCNVTFGPKKDARENREREMEREHAMASTHQNHTQSSERERTRPSQRHNTRASGVAVWGEVEMRIATRDNIYRNEKKQK